MPGPQALFCSGIGVRRSQGGSKSPSPHLGRSVAGQSQEMVLTNGVLQCRRRQPLGLRGTMQSLTPLPLCICLRERVGGLFILWGGAFSFWLWEEKEPHCVCLLKVLCAPWDMKIGHVLINQGGEKINKERNGLGELQRQHVCVCALSQQGEWHWHCFKGRSLRRP